MKVLVRLTRHGKPPKTRKRRITIAAYLLENDDGQKAGLADTYLPIAQLTLQARKTNWHKVLLPTTIVQRVLDSADKVLRLRVVCLECDDEAEVVMRPRRAQKKKKTGKKIARTGSQADGESRRSPVLIVNTKSSSRLRKTV